ncbi:MAG: hypothetical protein HYY24_21315 [Verrucomicrobia bacterium]|nr:hypothetical protein [Verrucomicrobiota bacterium]
MKTLTKIALLIVALTAAASAQAEWVRGYFRSNGTYVAPYYRTPANSMPYGNLSYGLTAPCIAASSPSIHLTFGTVWTPSRFPQVESISGSSIYFGDVSFHSYSTSSGRQLWGTSLDLGAVSFSNASLWNW